MNAARRNLVLRSTSVVVRVSLRREREERPRARERVKREIVFVFFSLRLDFFFLPLRLWMLLLLCCFDHPVFFWFWFWFFFLGRGGVVLFSLFLDGVAIPSKRSRSRRSRCKCGATSRGSTHHWRLRFADVEHVSSILASYRKFLFWKASSSSSYSSSLCVSGLWLCFALCFFLAVPV